MSKAFLLLANGRIFEGESFGATGTNIGEVVFNTGMAGYEETLTDPSYFGQIITQTYPLIGNYGITLEDAESSRVWAFGYIVRELCDYPSNFRCKMTLNDFLKQQNIIGIQGIDTRQLTRIIREAGVMNGVLTTEYDSKEALAADKDLLAQIKRYNVTNAVSSVTTNCITEHNNDGKYNVALFDFGYKANILRNLIKRDCHVYVVPSSTNAAALAQLNIDGIMLSNGPGDPAENTEIINNLKAICTMDKPIFGICLGHQLMALATQGKTEKLKYGHRGVNQPVTDFAKNRTFITSQNHGYAVVGDSINPLTAEISHVNANDKTVEGVRYKNIKCFTVQFHPEACGGPNDTEYLFDEFIQMMGGES